MSLRSDPAPSCHINKAMGGSGSRNSVSRWDIMGKRVRRDNDNSVWTHSELKTSLHLTIHTSDVLHASFVSGCLERRCMPPLQTPAAEGLEAEGGTGRLDVEERC